MEEFIAQTIYDACTDMDAADYEETKAEDIAAMTEGIAYVKSHYDTLYRALEMLANQLSEQGE